MKLIQLFLVIVTTVAITLAVTLYSPLAPKKVVSFDVKATIDAYQQSLAEKGIDRDTQIERIARFAEVIEKVTVQYADETNSIILVTPAVVTGSEDMTHILQKRIINEYMHEAK